MIAVNDNLTGAEFKAGVDPKTSIALVIDNDPNVARYYLMGDHKEGWGLLRFGLYQVDRRMPRQFMAFPVAAGAPALPRARLRAAGRQAPSPAQQGPRLAPPGGRMTTLPFLILGLAIGGVAVVDWRDGYRASALIVGSVALVELVFGTLMLLGVVGSGG
jgi:hypothetical protein